MAVAVYAAGLADLALAESGTYVELTNWDAGTLSTGYEADYFIQGATCKSSTVKTTQNSIAIDVGATTVPTDGAVLVWGVVFAPNSLDTYANGGIRACIGGSASAFRMWYVGGKDKSPNPYGGWKNFAVNPTVNSGAVTLNVNSTNSTFTRTSGDFLADGFEPGMNILITGCTAAGNNSRRTIATVTTTVITVTSNTGMVTESGTGDEQVRFCDAIEGTPTTTHQVMGVACRMPTTYPSKGAPFGLDAIRYGRCEMRVTEGDSGTPANFTDMAAKNDANDAGAGYNRWGLFSEQGGAFLWKGLLTIGYNGTAAYFQDSNKVINVDDTPGVRRGFNKISLETAGSTIILTNCVFAALGTRSPGQLVMTHAVTATITGCLFKDMDTFTFLSSVSVLSSSFVRCQEVDSGGGTFTDSSILTPAVAVNSSGFKWNSASNPGAYTTGMTFSKGTNAHHAIEFGLSSPLSISLTNMTFSGFNASDEQDDSTLHILRTSGDVTINASGCSGNLSYKSAGANVSIVNTVNLTLTGLQDGSDISILEAGTTTELENVQENSGTTYVYGYAGGDAGNYIDIGVFKAGYIPFYTRAYQLAATNASVPISQVIDRAYLE